MHITFTLPAAAGARSVALAGDFNGWSTEQHLFHQDGHGKWTITVDLEAGRTYAYRFWVDGARWENDWRADAYAPNQFGGDDSVLDLTVGSHRLTRLQSAEPAAP
jgi:1,4-alpha-glucan branching enzyme